jgi:cytochrome c-type biogenesis protein CcmE
MTSSDGPGFDTEDGLDAGPDLTPRTELETAAEAVRREMRAGQRKWIWSIVAVLVVVAGFVIVQFLRDATLFFRNVDEAIEQREDLSDRRFRMQGRVIPASVDTSTGTVTFEIMHNCEIAGVRHLTDPPELFENPWIPVVLEGHWELGSVDLVSGPDTHIFVSDRMLVKHTNEYSSDFDSRITSNLPQDFFDGCGITRSDVGAEG